jgi:hypothetical protein
LSVGAITVLSMPTIDVDLSGWDLPPFEVASWPTVPPAEPEFWGGVALGSFVLASAAESPIDIGRAAADQLASVQPGLAELARLGATDFDTLDATARVDALLAFNRQQAWFEARQQQLLALIFERDSSDQQWCVEEVGAALRLSGTVARSKLQNAEQLCKRLPGTLQALSEGRIAVPQLTAITEASYELPDELLTAFERSVLARADEQSLTQLKRSIKRAVLSLEPRTAEQKRQRSVADRQVRIVPADHGMAWIMALLPAAEANAVYQRVDGAARQARKDDSRTLDQLRADALVSGVLNGISGELPTSHGRQPGVNVVVCLSTLIGADDEPGWLDSYGPISAGYAREIAHDPTGTWRRMLTDPVTGQLLDYGTTRYRPPRHLAEHVIARDGECGFPFCTHPARRSDLDHVAPYPQGETAASNLQPLHRRHHNAKTEAGWVGYRDGPTGTTYWTSPQGRRYRTRPPERWKAPVMPPSPAT